MKQSLKNRVWICLSGSETERFLNIASFRGVILYQLHRTSSGIEAMASAGDVLKLCRLRGKTQVSIRIMKRTGPYYFWKKTRRKRVGMVCGVFAFAALYLMSRFVWDIDFFGNVRYTDSYLLSFVQKEGYKPGMKISDVVCENLEKQLREQFVDITWVSARLEGTRLVVEIEENNTAVATKKEQEPCSIQATKGGQIVRMVTRQGTPLVKRGDYVEKGDLLVSGYLPIYNDSQEIVGYEMTAASADVWIEYEEKFELKIPRSQTIRHYTAEQVRPGLLLFGHRFCLPGSVPSDQKKEGSELYIEQRQWKLFENFYLPFYSETYRLFLYDDAQISYDDASLKQQADKKYREFIVQLEKLGVEIIENNVTIESDPEYYQMNVQLLLEENAAKQTDLEASYEENAKRSDSE